MLSIVWDGDESENQSYGCTTLAVEPFWAGCPEKHFHCGIDIGSPGCKGKPLYAARAGIVSAISYGVLGVRVASGETDYYIHGVYSVAFGQAIERGQRVGVFGDRIPVGGALDGPHLHFEVQAPGGALNHPLSSRDPVPVLQILAGAAGGEVHLATEAEIEQALKATGVVGGITSLYNALVGPADRLATGGKPTQPLYEQLVALNVGVAALTAAIKAMPASGQAGPEPTSLTIEVPAQTITGKLA